MSEVRVDNIVDYGGKGAPTFDNGAVISGVSSLGNQAKIGSNVTITSGGINVSGVTTAATLSGNLTGDVSAGFLTATSTVIGSGVTINAGGLNITGVMTATTFEGSGASMTGVAMTITPMAYNPDVNDSTVPVGTGIGITFDHRILAGSGNITLREDSASGTVVENFGVGSSVTIAGRKVIIDPTSDLTAGGTYHISYPSGAFTNTSGDVSYVGTAYTFGVKPTFVTLWSWGSNSYGVLGQNSEVKYSSPVQIPGDNWKNLGISGGNILATKTNGTLWSWGNNSKGQLGLNDKIARSSPTQIPGTTWSQAFQALEYNAALRTDGTLWTWGINAAGEQGHNNRTYRSSPTQVPGTTWATFSGGNQSALASRTDGTLWSWGTNAQGRLGLLNEGTGNQYSSPTQIPGTIWGTTKGKLSSGNNFSIAIRTDGTLWSWGYNYGGFLGINVSGESGTPASRSSPCQVPGTTWSKVVSGNSSSIAIKTDGTLWSWGYNNVGQLAQNNRTHRSSPIQIPGTTWNNVVCSYQSFGATKTDGTLWSWGYNANGNLGLNNRTNYSSPVQVPGTTWNMDDITAWRASMSIAFKVE